MKAYPYLHSASPKLEYRSILCPDFLWNEDGREFLSKAGVYTSQTSPVQWVTATHPTEGKIGILYRIRFAEARDIDQDGTDLLKDGAGRRIAATHGFIVKNPDEHFHFTEQHLDLAEQATRKLFAEFFVTGRDPGWPDSKVIALPPIELAPDTSSPRLSYVERKLDVAHGTSGDKAGDRRASGAMPPRAPQPGNGNLFSDVSGLIDALRGPAKEGRAASGARPLIVGLLLVIAAWLVIRKIGFLATLLGAGICLAVMAKLFAGKS